LDENFNSVHHRSWNLAAIGLPRVNPKKQRRPTLTAKEMTTLLSKAEGQYQMFYFFCLVTGMRVSMFSGASVKSCCNEAMHGKS
jgi:integrase